MMTSNQMAIHTLDGCTTDKTIIQSGSLGFTNCSAGPGCTVHENKANSFGEGFATAGGGVWATQFDVAGVFIWFWSVSTYVRLVSLVLTRRIRMGDYRRDRTYPQS